jgi:hypothetical protein
VANGTLVDLIGQLNEIKEEKQPAFILGSCLPDMTTNLWGGSDESVASIRFPADSEMRLYLTLCSFSVSTTSDRDICSSSRNGWASGGSPPVCYFNGHLEVWKESGSIQTEIWGDPPVQRRTAVIPLEEGVFSIGRRRMHCNMPPRGQRKGA